jgi:predicted metal-dependent hydrolase
MAAPTASMKHAQKNSQRRPDQVGEKMASNPMLGVRASSCGIRKMKTRWGTCNTEVRRIWLNLELAKKAPPCLEYILVHELAHLLERKHNDRFVALMNRHLPSWRLLRQKLNSEPLAHETWSY